MKVLVFGAGQLAQMMYLDAAPLGVEVMALDVATEEVVHPVSKQKLDVTFEYAMGDVDVITAEFEHVPEHLLEAADKTGKLFPNMRSILTGADRVREKQLLDSCGVPNAKFKVVSNLVQLDECIEELGERIIFKASRDGYDGYGQWRIGNAEELADVKAALASMDLLNVPVIAERMVDFDREISVIGARTASGEVAIYNIAENLHHQGQLHVSVAPATHISPELEVQAKDIFDKISSKLEYVGVLAIELFDVKGEMLVNEIAPRVHNSGHWTQNGADTSQFEQHIRAVLNFPLGSTEVNQCSAMINVIGCTSFSRDLISIPGCHLHWYGKALKPKRKMGHINVTAPDYSALGKKLKALSEFLPLEYFPHLISEAERLEAQSSD